jgi:hypothetical protein
MWLGIIVLMLSGELTGSVSMFSTKQACEAAVGTIVEQVVKKNHPEISILYTTCTQPRNA